MKRLFIFVAVLLWASSVWGSTPQDQNKAIARRVFDEIFNQGKYEVANEIYAPDFINHGFNTDIGLKEDQAGYQSHRQTNGSRRRSGHGAVDCRRDKHRRRQRLARDR